MNDATALIQNLGGEMKREKGTCHNDAESLGTDSPEYHTDDPEGVWNETLRIMRKLVTTPKKESAGQVQNEKKR